MQFKNLKDLLQKFSNEEVCRDYMEQRFFPGGKPECPYCQYNEKIYRIEAGKRYKCKQCQKKFSITVGTIFENSNIPLSTWFGAIYLITAHKKGISSLQLHRDLGVTQKTAWFMLHRIREMLKDKSPEIFTKPTELDETYIGGKESNKHASKRDRKNRGRSLKSKTPVIGLVERGGKIYTKVVPSVKMKYVMPIIKNMVEKDNVIITDEWPGYMRLGENFEHFVINHKRGEYVIGKIHTNTIEGFWSLLKRGIIGIYHSVSYKHLDAYCNEFSFRYNTRKMTEADRFNLASTQAVSRRIRYKDLIGKI